MKSTISSCLHPAKAHRLRWQAIGLALAGCITFTGSMGKCTEPPAASLAEIEVQDLSGKLVQPLADEGQKATVLFFVIHDCPVANSYAPEISRIMSDYLPKGVRSYLVYVEDDLSRSKARKHASEYGFKSGALMDPKHLLSKAAGATISPEAVVFSPRSDVLYRGRIDDRVTDFGRRRAEPTRRDLRLTLDAVLAGQPVPARLTKAIGCYIPEEFTPKTKH